MCRQTVQKRGSAPPTTRFTRRSGCTRSRHDTSVSRRTLTAIAVRRLPLSPKTQKSTENRCFFHALTEIRCRQNFPFFLTGKAQHIDTPYLEVPVRFNMPIYAFLHNVLLVRKLNPHTKLQCSKTPFDWYIRHLQFNIHTKLQCSKTGQWNIIAFISLISIRNYNALKLTFGENYEDTRLISIRNYNALKLGFYAVHVIRSLISIRNYNALKLVQDVTTSPSSLISIRNYNALKP